MMSGEKIGSKFKQKHFRPAPSQETLHCYVSMGSGSDGDAAAETWIPLIPWEGRDCLHLWICCFCVTISMDTMCLYYCPTYGICHNYKQLCFQVLTGPAQLHKTYRFHPRVCVCHWGPPGSSDHFADVSKKCTLVLAACLHPRSLTTVPRTFSDKYFQKERDDLQNGKGFFIDKQWVIHIPSETEANLSSSRKEHKCQWRGEWREP